MTSGWIGVDLDGTLASSADWRGLHHVGPPVPAMLKRVKAWLAEGREVRIFTARASVPEDERDEVVRVIQDWCEAQGLPRLAVTNVKDFAMIELWDDRAVRVVRNMGVAVGFVR